MGPVGERGDIERQVTPQHKLGNATANRMHVWTDFFESAAARRCILPAGQCAAYYAGRCLALGVLMLFLSSLYQENAFTCEDTFYHPAGTARGTQQRRQDAGHYAMPADANCNHVRFASASLNYCSNGSANNSGCTA